MLRQFLHFGIGVIILSLLVRTWIALGLIVPVVVAGGSMAPHLHGPHRAGRCEGCRGTLAVGLEYASPRQTLRCPDCGREVLAGQLTPASGDAIWVDRVSLLFRSPRRWEPIVFRCPQRATDYCIKRVVGLPGETVSLQQGDVVIDGQIVRKTLREQLALRIPMHQDAAVANHWRPDPQPSVWRRGPSGWQATMTPRDTRRQVLRFQPRNSWPLRDDYFYNADSFAAENALSDLMVACDVECRGRTTLAFRWATAEHEWRIDLMPSREAVSLEMDGIEVRTAGLPNPGDPFHEVLVSRFDRQTLVAIDGTTLLQVPDHAAAHWIPLRRLEILAEGAGTVAVRKLQIFRDVYYTTPYWLDEPSEGASAGGASPRWRLGPGEYFVLGDNSPVSDDSRRWHPRPGLEAKLILGRPSRPWWRSP